VEKLPSRQEVWSVEFGN